MVDWIERQRHQMAALFLLGDIFDYWFEYRTVVPKGFVRLLAKLAELTESGIPVYFLCGNHDTWTLDYFQKEIGMQVYTGNIELAVGEARFLLGHGDGLGKGEKGYKLMKAIFNAQISRVLYAALHPYWGAMIAGKMSRHSRKSGIRRNQGPEKIEENAPKPFLAETREHTKNKNLLVFMQRYLRQHPIDGFIFAHRHWPVLVEINSESPEVRHLDIAPVAPEKRTSHKAYYMNTGDWIRYFTYGSFDGKNLKLEGDLIRKTF